ncbi:unnamed protein product [Brassica rapa subsp. trilocularis]|uniref:(rape) hypothetical protein n=1 Tax=Brassica napus TaxID=3708 RepID=A0A816TIT3_BRANA|nr:unnamed protein product [Brassica napus]
MEGSVFTPCLEGMKHVKSEHGEMLSKPFLDLCKTILPVLDKFGPAMTLVKSDIGGNISRLEKNYLSDPDKYKYLYTFVQGEIESKTAKGSSSCTNGLLWLTRAMDFLVELFRNLVAHQDWSMSQACGDSYQKTLKKWHGWLASSSFTMALKLAPDRKKFIDVISGSGDIYTDMAKFCSEFGPLLQYNHKFLMNDFKPQEHEQGQVVSRGNSNKYNPQEMNQSGAGLKELLPPNTNEKQKQKTRRKPGSAASPNHNGGSASSDGSVKQSRHNRSKHGSMDSSLSDQEPSVRSRRRGGGGSSKDTEGSSNLIIPDGSAPPRKATSRPRKLKGSIGGEGSVKKSSKGTVDDTCNDII